MRFMMIMFPSDCASGKPGMIPDLKAIEVMRKYNEQLHKAGVLLALDGLTPPSMGARVTFKAESRKSPTARSASPRKRSEASGIHAAASRL